MAQNIATHTSEVLSVTVNNNDQLIGSSSLDGMICIHELGNEYALKHKFSLNGYKCSSVLFSNMKEF